MPKRGRQDDQDSTSSISSNEADHLFANLSPEKENAKRSIIEHQQKIIRKLENKIKSMTDHKVKIESSKTKSKPKYVYPCPVETCSFKGLNIKRHLERNHKGAKVNVTERARGAFKRSKRLCVLCKRYYVRLHQHINRSHKNVQIGSELYRSVLRKAHKDYIARKREPLPEITTTPGTSRQSGSNSGSISSGNSGGPHEKSEAKDDRNERRQVSKQARRGKRDGRQKNVMKQVHADLEGDKEEDKKERENKTEEMSDDSWKWGGGEESDYSDLSNEDSDLSEEELELLLDDQKRKTNNRDQRKVTMEKMAGQEMNVGGRAEVENESDMGSKCTDVESEDGMDTEILVRDSESEGGRDVNWERGSDEQSDYRDLTDEGSDLLEGEFEMLLSDRGKPLQKDSGNKDDEEKIGQDTTVSSNRDDEHNDDEWAGSNKDDDSVEEEISTVRDDEDKNKTTINWLNDIDDGDAEHVKLIKSFAQYSALPDGGRIPERDILIHCQRLLKLLQIISPGNLDFKDVFLDPKKIWTDFVVPNLKGTTEGKTLTPKTVRSYLISLSKVCNFMIGSDETDKNLITYIQSLRDRLPSWRFSLRKEVKVQEEVKYEKDVKEMPSVSQVQQVLSCTMSQNIVQHLIRGADGDVIFSQRECEQIRDYLITRMIIENMLRPGVVEQFTVKLLNDAKWQKQSENYSITVITHKTVVQYGATHPTLSRDLFKYLQTYVEHIRPMFVTDGNLPEHQQPVFVNSNGNKIDSSVAGQKMKEYAKKTGIQCNFIPTLLRKTSSTAARNLPKEEQQAHADLLEHRLETEVRDYQRYEKKTTQAKAAVANQKRLGLQEYLNPSLICTGLPSIRDTEESKDGGYKLDSDSNGRKVQIDFPCNKDDPKKQSEKETSKQQSHSTCKDRELAEPDQSEQPLVPSIKKTNERDPAPKPGNSCTNTTESPGGGRPERFSQAQVDAIRKAFALFIESNARPSPTEVIQCCTEYKELSALHVKEIQNKVVYEGKKVVRQPPSSIMKSDDKVQSWLVHTDPGSDIVPPTECSSKSRWPHGDEETMENYFKEMVHAKTAPLKKDVKSRLYSENAPQDIKELIDRDDSEAWQNRLINKVKSLWRKAHGKY